MMAMIYALIGSSAVNASPPDESRPTLKAGSAVARRGEIAYGQIGVPESKDAAVSIPVAVIHGARPGPVLALMAGSHGTEYASIVALSRLVARLDPRTLSGSVIVAPLLNPASFEQMTVHLNPVDGKGLFGPDPDPAGTQSQRILSAVAEQVVKPADIVVDLHGGDLDEDARPFMLWLRGGNPSQDAASLKLVLAFGLDHVQIRDIDPADPAEQRALPGYALGLGKVTLLGAVGRSGLVLPEDLSVLEEGVLNLLGSLGMIERATHPVEHPVWIDRGHRVGAEGPGMFFPTVTRGSRVSEGAKVGTTTDYLGRVIGDVRSPASGVVNYIRGVPSMWKGATLIMVSRIMSEAPPYLKPSR